ncbi:MAG: DEAD/DEAH box helicase, partial [Acidimicrobiia bacterium]
MPTRVRISDGKSILDLVFFNQPWRAKQLRVGTLIAASGKVSLFGGRRQMNSPLVDVIKDPEEAIKIIPVYPATAEIHTAWLRRIIRAAIEDFMPLADPLPEKLLSAHRLMDRTTAIMTYHFPDEMKDMWIARKRLVFDELFTLQTGLAYRKRRIERDTTGIAHQAGGDLPRKYVEALPFRLTKAQENAIEEIERDMSKAVPMHRLLQGEVGSGKTAVALYAALAAVDGGYQAAIMAPTEVLAFQHHLTITNLLAPLVGSVPREEGGLGPLGGQLDLLGVPEVVLLTGSITGARRKKALERIADGSALIVVGTHALIQEGIDFARLGLA